MADGGELTDLGATELRDAIAAGRCSARDAVTACLARIEALDRRGPELRAVIETNPVALDIAAARDAMPSRERGSLHGVPVLVKANIDTGDGMATSAGSLALAEHRAAADARLVARLRAAGAVLLGKTNLSEWANFRSTGSISGWSSLGGQTRNPYDPHRNPCGSSSGSAVAVAARMAPLAVGTETNGSIVCPAGVNGVVGVKPTVRLVSQHGIVPVAASQDTAGPMARSVADAMLLLAAMAIPDAPTKPATLGDGERLDGVRIGVLRDYDGAASHAGVEAVFEETIRTLAALGAVCVDPVVADIDDELPVAGYSLLMMEFQRGIERYLASHRTGFATLADLVAFNAAHADAVMPLFDQDIFEAALDFPEDATDAEAAEVYAVVRRNSVTAMRRIVADLFNRHDLHALVAPANRPAWPIEQRNVPHVGSGSFAAISGRPSIAVPAALADGLPVAVAFIGRPWNEATLAAIAERFETARGPFPPPTYRPLAADAASDQ